jgi:hypothetical protein
MLAKEGFTRAWNKQSKVKHTTSINIRILSEIQENLPTVIYYENVDHS